MENTPSTNLYDLLVTQDLEPEILDSKGQPANSPEEAELFSFDWHGQERDYGTVVILMGNDQDLEVYYGDNLGRNMDAQDKNKWFDFLLQIKNFAMRNLLSFKLNNINRLKYTMKGMAAIREGLFEGFSGTRQKSYSAGPKRVRLVIEHSRPLEEGEARHHAIKSMFIETGEGERFRVPSRSLMHGKMMERHVAEGGTPYDAFGNHINDMIQEMAVLRRFIRATRGRELDGDSARLTSEAIKHYQELKDKAKRMVSQRGYRQEFESFNPTEFSDAEVTVEAIRDMFTERKIDDRIESALPILAKLQPKSMPEAVEFQYWANNITEGTWSLPDNPEDLDTLRDMMSRPLVVGTDATNATEQLYDVFGDDKLFDQLAKLAEFDPNADARPLVAQRLEDFGIRLDFDDEVDEDLDVDGVMMTKPSNMSSESIDHDLLRLRKLILK